MEELIKHIETKAAFTTGGLLVCVPLNTHSIYPSKHQYFYPFSVRFNVLPSPVHQRKEQRAIDRFQAMASK